MSKLTPQQLHHYQKEAVLSCLYQDEAMLWLQMGLGKTAITLTAIVDRMRAGQVKKVLVLGPLRVVQSVWAKEARKWTHTDHLRFSKILGSKESRQRGLFAEADIYLCNYENLNWLAEALDKFYISRGLPIPFDMVVYDEITKMKSSTSVRIAGGTRDVKDRRTGNMVPVKRIGWRKHINAFKYKIGLTGTPAPNGYKDLHGQYLALDGGKRLGTHKTHYEEAYFSKGYDGWSIQVTPVGRTIIDQKIADITLKMDADEYLPDMPKVTVVDLRIALPASARKQYQDMENHMFSELDGGNTVEVFTRASAAMKCLQISNGAIYTPVMEDAYTHEDSSSKLVKGAWEAVHKAKLDALADIVEEANGAPVLVAYSFKSDAERIMQHFKKLKPVNLTATPSSRTEAVIDAWRRGETQLMIGHPASMGHGIDGLQDTGSLAVWFGPTYSLELYEQFNARLNRQGQKRPVTIIRLIGEDTVDEAVIMALAGKSTTEAELKSAIQNYRRQKAGGSFPVPEAAAVLAPPAPYSFI